MTLRLPLTVCVAASLLMACEGCKSPPPAQPMLTPMPPPQTAPPPPPLPAPCSQAELLATSAAMQARAAAEAPGMKPEGPPVCGIVGAPGEIVNGPLFVLEPGYCYTFLGQSLPQVADMEMSLQLDATGLAGTLLPSSMGSMASMAQTNLLVSTSPGERVSMGEKQFCYQPPPLPGTVKLVLKARAGAGPIAAQMFRKKKF